MLYTIVSKCWDVFNIDCGDVANNVQHIRGHPSYAALLDVLNRLKPSDVGHPEFVSSSSTEDAQNGAEHPHTKELVVYQSIYQCPFFDVSLFVFPAGACIPLHNHPDMMVMNQIVSGKLRIKSYDLVDSAEFPSSPSFQGGSISVRLREEKTFSSPCTKFVDQIHSNIHCCYALEPTIMLDITAPPYNNPTRICRYYREHSFTPEKDVPKYLTPLNALLSFDDVDEDGVEDRPVIRLSEVKPPSAFMKERAFPVARLLQVPPPPRKTDAVSVSTTANEK